MTALLLALLAVFGAGPDLAAPPPPDVRLFFEATVADDERARAALDQIAASWKDGYAPMIVDLARFLRPRGRAPAGGGLAEGAIGDGESDPLGVGGRGFPESGGAPEAASPSARMRERLVRFLEKQTGQRFGDDLRRWRRWYWSRPYDPHPDYAFFKAAVYSRVDRRMASFFEPGGQERIRLDEVDWGGVAVNGIPPLDHPKVVLARDATYLKDDHIVFGIAVGGEARAYPKRVLAWHEMARDRLGGEELVVVYCTLCGTVIPYNAEVGGRKRTFGTSGLLYRSNKLMFDEESMSLWSTVEGRPVLGALAGQPLELQAHPVVTTTWKAWVAAHPETTVLSLDTGFRRDYGEGAAYRAYFATDRLMFEVPKTDDRLRNKDEVLALLLRPAGAPPDAPRRALALSTAFLEKDRLHPLSFGGHELVVITSPGGANRVYGSSGVRFVRLRPDGRLEDTEGRRWQATEDALVVEGAAASPLPRVAARRAFWFGWCAQYPETELVK